VVIKPVVDRDNHSSLDVIPDHEVNPADGNYPDNCNDTDENWHRVQMFVFDTLTMKAAACYEGDEESCTDLGASATSNQASITTSGGSLPQGTAKELAGQLVPLIDSGKIKCVGFGGNNFNCSDITNTAKGVSIRGGQGCRVDALTPTLLGMVLKLAQMGHTFLLSSLCSDHSNDGIGGHSTGQAVDFNNIDGVRMGPSPTTPWSAQQIEVGQKLDQDIASFMPHATGFGQTQCHPTFSFLSGFNIFPDKCHHQHIQVAS
jgi:hypothetical protein